MDARVEEARRCFDAHDTNGNGTIEADELQKVLTTLGLRHEGESEEAFRALVGRCMREHDANADGTLSFNEFQRLYNAILEVSTDDRREAASGSSLDARGLPSETFTAGPAQRDPVTGGITTDVNRDFAFGKTLGTGGFAVVKMGTHRSTKLEYAVKIINIAAAGSNEDNGMSLSEIAEEIRLTMSVKSTENAVKVFDFYVTATHVYVIMELLKGGELLDAIMDSGTFSEQDCAKVMFQLFKGLVSIHARSITHRDLKLENLIFAEKNRLDSLRIADFGLAKKMKTARGRLVAQCGTPAYVAPEVITGQQYTPAVDMWASGVIMYATLCGELPFDHRDQQSSFRLIAKGKFHSPCKSLSPECDDLMRKLLCVDKVKRLTAAEALEHRWIRRHTSKIGGGASVRDMSKQSRVARAATSKLGSDLATRRLAKGELLIRKGERAKEVFLIKEGTVAVEVEVNGEIVVVAARGEGEFVGEMGVGIDAEGSEIADSPSRDRSARTSPGPGSGSDSPTSPVPNLGALTLGATLTHVKDKWVGGRRGADVRATTDVTVAVMNGAQMRWILEHDYGADGELSSAVKHRREELEAATGANAPARGEWKTGRK